MKRVKRLTQIKLSYVFEAMLLILIQSHILQFNINSISYCCTKLYIVQDTKSNKFQIH